MPPGNDGTVVLPPPADIEAPRLVWSRLPPIARPAVPAVPHGRDPTRHGQTKHPPNLPMTADARKAVTADIIAENQAGRIRGPFAQPPVPGFFVSPLGAAPESGNRWRRIHHLSYPRGGGYPSVNDRVYGHKELKLTSFNEVTQALLKLGPSTRLLKLDIRAAYRLIMLRPDTWHFFGMRWEKSLLSGRLPPLRPPMWTSPVGALCTRPATRHATGSRAASDHLSLHR